MKIVVGSKNQAKINAVTQVFEYHFDNLEVIGVVVDSGVADQPLSLDDMYQGALNRAKEAMRVVPDAEYSIGIEGGINKTSFGWLKSALVVIVNSNGEIGVGSSGGIVLPKKIMSEVISGENLSDVVDKIFGTKDVGKGIGIFGVLTNEFLDRSAGTQHGVAFALSRFLHPKLWE